MAINAPRIGQLTYISHQDPSIDWDAAKEHGITLDSFRDNPTEETISKLQAKAGEKLTLFYLDLPHPNVMREAMQESEGIAQAHFLAIKCLKSVENLFDENGREVKLSHIRATRTLDSGSIEKIPASIIWEIGFFLMVIGSGIERPLPRS